MFDNPGVRAIENVLGMASSRWFDPSEPPAPQPADIYPGKYNKCKYTPLELAYTLALTPGTKADLDYLFELGKADGAVWAAEVGLSNPAACSDGSEEVAAGSSGMASGVEAPHDADTAMVVSDSIVPAEDTAAAAAPAADVPTSGNGDGDDTAAAAGADTVEPDDAYGPFSADIVVGSAPAAVVASSGEAVGQQQLEIAAAADADAFTTEAVPHVVVQLRQQHRLEVAAEADAAAAIEAESAAAGSETAAAAGAFAVDANGSSAVEAEDAAAGAPGVSNAVVASHADTAAVADIAAGAAVDGASSAAAVGGSTAATAVPAKGTADNNAGSASKRIPFWLRSRG
jgi:hypothetical protein